MCVWSQNIHSCGDFLSLGYKSIIFLSPLTKMSPLPHSLQATILFNSSLRIMVNVYLIYALSED